MDYKASGVDIDAGNEAVRRIRGLARSTFTPAVLSDIGSFGGLFRLEPGRFKDPVLVASADGVGTKLKVAFMADKHDTVGMDLVNHCVNDILVQGAEPLFFLDYLATGTLSPAVAESIVGGMAAACRENGCALLGGETAEMPGLYAERHFDLAGTIVGLVDLADVPKRENVQPGDAIVGLPARGLHTNGYTLARKLLDVRSFADALLAEHPSYYADVRAIQQVARVHAMAHITGGGLLENLPRTLPENVKAICEQSRWEVPEIFQELVRRGDLAYEERYRTFNMGIGYTLVVPFADAPKAVQAVAGAKVIGWIESRAQDEPQVVVHPARA